MGGARFHVSPACSGVGERLLMKRFSIRRLLELPPRLIFSKAAAKAASPSATDAPCGETLSNLFREARFPGPGVPDNLFKQRCPARLIRHLREDAAAERQRLIKHNAGEACAHRFDLLGSGPVQVVHTAAPGFAGCRLTMSPGRSKSVPPWK